jgi:hypothetical protein
LAEPQKVNPALLVLNRAYTDCCDQTDNLDSLRTNFTITFNDVEVTVLHGLVQNDYVTELRQAKLFVLEIGIKILLVLTQDEIGESLVEAVNDINSVDVIGYTNQQELKD